MRIKIKKIGYLALLAVICLSIPVVFGIATIGLPDSLLLDTTNFAYEYGPGVIASRVAAPTGVLFTFTGLNPSSGTTVGDDFPITTAGGGGDHTGYLGYGMYFKNVGDEAVMVSLKFNTGWTDPPQDWTYDTFWQSEWTTINPGETKYLFLDYSSAICWGATDDPNPAWQYADGSGGHAVHRLDTATDIGFQILGGDCDGRVIVSKDPIGSVNVIPEVPLGTITSLLAMVGGVLIYGKKF